ncbi:MAG: FAD-dependent oxidoreductase, partial [Anaerovoracaceae bacterium]
NGVPDMRLIDGDEARAMEPLLSKDVIGAMVAPTTGIISPFKLILAAAENAAENGVDFSFDSCVEQIEGDKGQYLIHTNKGCVKASYVVNVSGEGAAEIESFVRERELIIKPRRGEYFVFDCPSPIGHVIYQAQENDEKGTLVAPTTDGNMLAGPTSVNVRGYQCTETSKAGLAHIESVAKKILPGLDLGKVIASFAGVRANIENVPKEEKDFVVRTSKAGFVSALGIKNPGMTAAPYLVKQLVDLLIEEGLPTSKNKQYNPIYRQKPTFLKASAEVQAQLLQKNPAYGHVICRCEGITEGDILAVLGGTLPPHNINGLKKRLRTGMGRCQGGFCLPQIIDILSREWNLSPQEINKGGKGSPIIKGRLR